MMRVENPEDYQWPIPTNGSTYDLNAAPAHDAPSIWVPDRKSGGYTLRDITKQRRPIGFAR